MWKFGAAERTFAANYASRMAIFVNTELCNLKELFGSPKEVVWVYQLLKLLGDNWFRWCWRGDDVLLAMVLVRD
jgi:hypothetical protein